MSPHQQGHPAGGSRALGCSEHTEQGLEMPPALPSPKAGRCSHPLPVPGTASWVWGMQTSDQTSDQIFPHSLLTKKSLKCTLSQQRAGILLSSADRRHRAELRCEPRANSKGQSRSWVDLFAE